VAAYVARARDRDLASLEILAVEAEREGQRLVRRLVEEWRSGANRFDRAGEALFVLWRGRRAAATCGLNRDPFVAAPEVGRLRHVYVHPALRRAGVGRLLVRVALVEARASFARLRLRTSAAPAARLYERLGFARVDEADATHALVLSPATGASCPRS
jgi:ribosomal protein S18 acetylase RimI-like enzyme